jgi:uncharacterized protein YndB with AHSA1/START domain
MLKALLVIVAVLVVCVVAVLAYAATKPDTFTIQRSATIKAPPERVFALLTDFPAWRQWSPWENLDPDLKRTYSGAPNGKGAVYEWEGNKAGAGRMEILDAPAPQKVTINSTSGARSRPTTPPSSRCSRKATRPPSLGRCGDRTSSSAR